MAIPSLLLSPDESRDRNGPVTPTVIGDVAVVEGEYGQAWMFTDSGQRVSTNVGSRMNTEQGTVFVRVYIPAEVAVCYPLSVNYTNGITLGTISQLSYSAWVGGSRTSSITDSTRDHWVVIAVRYNDGVGQFFLNGAGSGDGAVGTPTLGSTISLWGQADDRMHTTESVLIFPEALSDAEIQRISTMDKAWRWEDLMPKIGGVRTVHSPAPFAARSTHEEI